MSTADPKTIPSPPPSLGRIVHYVGHSGLHYAALVIATGAELFWKYPDQQHRANLKVETYNGAPFDDVGPCRQPSNTRSAVPYDPTGTTPHSWHWPERVE